jgi:DNA-binding NarL/FixJ family response regulator
MSLLPVIHQLRPELKVIVVTMHVDPFIADLCFQAGADGFLPKTADPSTFFEAIGVLLGGGRYRSPLLVTTYEDQRNARPLGHLTSRQQDVMVALGRGMTQKEIAKSLGLSPAAVAYHVNNVKRVLGIPRTVDLIRKAVLLGSATTPHSP